MHHGSKYLLVQVSSASVVGDPREQMLQAVSVSFLSLLEVHW